MKKSTLITLLSLFFSLFLFCSTNAQEYGKLFRKSQADSLYGPVKYSMQVPTANLQKLLKMTKKVILFKYNGGRFFVTDNNRRTLSLTSTSTEFSQQSEAATTVEATLDSPMKSFSVSKVQELIDNGQSSVTVIEQREGVLSITNGAVTLEMGAICPPFCN